MALELQSPPVINLTPNVGTVTLQAVPPTLSLSSPNPATDGGVAAYVNDAASATRGALSATFARATDEDGQPLTGKTSRIVFDEFGDVTDILLEDI